MIYASRFAVGRRIPCWIRVQKTVGFFSGRMSKACNSRPFCSRFNSTTNEAARKSRTRELAEQMAEKRRAAHKARIGSGNGGDGSSSGGVSLAGFYTASSIVGAAALSYLCFSEEGSKWFDEYIYRGTPLGIAGDWLKARIGEQTESFTNPLTDKLLPEVPPESLLPGMKPLRTLVLDFEDTLCHFEWDRKNGWRAVKRPGVDLFLRRLFNFYEIVLFTSGVQGFLEPFIYNMDPYALIQHKLYRESTLYVNGEYIKDLASLNRDLARVVVIDDSREAVQYHPENLILVPKFDKPEQMPNDRSLLDLIPFLEDLVERDIPDVREEIRKYAGKEIGPEFKRRREERLQQVQAEAQNTLKGAILGSFMGGRNRVASTDRDAADSNDIKPVDDHIPALDLRMTPLNEVNSLRELPKLDEKPEKVERNVGNFWGSIIK